MEVQQAEEVEAAELARVDKLEAELAQAERELSELGASSSELDGLEERYWHDFNDFQLQLRAHIDDRDVLVNKVHAPQCALSPAGRCLSTATCRPIFCCGEHVCITWSRCMKNVAHGSTTVHADGSRKPV